MRRLAWSQLRFGAVRTVALLAGMLVAATAFTVLTAASRTAQLRTTGTVSAHFRAAYDILVRPRGARSQLEAQTGTVQPNFLSGLYGGITLADYRQIQHLPGVEVAAPVAMVGYSLPVQPVAVPLPASAVRVRVRPAAVPVRHDLGQRGRHHPDSPAGLLRLSHPPPAQHGQRHRRGLRDPGPSRVGVCPAPGRAASPFGPAAQAETWCWSRRNGLDGNGDEFGLTARRPGLPVAWKFPMLIAAVDPAAEAKLDDLPHALTSGHYLAENAGPGTIDSGKTSLVTFPVLAAADSGIGEWSQTEVRRLADPSAAADAERGHHEPGRDRAGSAGAQRPHQCSAGLPAAAGRHDREARGLPGDRRVLVGRRDQLHPGAGRGSDPGGGAQPAVGVALGHRGRRVRAGPDG